MATTGQTETGRTAELTINPTERLDADFVDDETPTQVYVEVSNSGRSQMAIVAAGEAGRYSFDFSVNRGGIEIEKAYIDGMREHVTDLPEWIEAVRAAIEDRFGL